MLVFIFLKIVVVVVDVFAFVVLGFWRQNELPDRIRRRMSRRRGKKGAPELRLGNPACQRTRRIHK